MVFLPLTLTIGLCLVFSLAVFFLRAHLVGRAGKPTPVPLDPRPGRAADH
jgi:hypothetical protein